MEKIIEWIYTQERKLGLYKGGLVGGLVLGLVGGLVWGLVLGLVWGLVWGLGSVIGVNIISTFNLTFQWYYYLIALVILMEIIFWFFDKKKPRKNQSKISFTAERKFVSLLWSVGLLTQVFGGYNNFNKLKELITPSVFQEILRWTGYIGVGLLALAAIIGVFYGLLYINSLKYRW